MDTPGINPTTFKIVLNRDFFQQGDVLNEKVIVHDKGDHCVDYTHYVVQTLEDLRVEVLHFKFLCKYNLL